MWSDNAGTGTDVVLMTKALIVRNVKGFPFCPKMSATDKESVLGMVRQAASKMDLKFLRADEISEEVSEDLYEKYMIGYETAKNPSNKGLLINEEDGVCITVNDREHIAIEVVANGSAVASTYAKADAIASALESEMDIAYSEKYGFLTSDVRKAGTGLRLFTLVSIPGIEKTADALNILTRRLAKYDWKIAALVTGAGVKVPGVYVLGSVATLGVTEKEMVGRAAQVIEDVVKLEKTCRETICKRKSAVVEDQFFRSYAMLRYARRLETQEIFTYLNWLRMGLDAFTQDEDMNLDWNKINKITYKMNRNGNELNRKMNGSPAANKENADVIRSILKGDEC